MNFACQPEQLALASEADAFGKRELNGAVTERDSLGVFDRVLWEKCAAFGVLRWAMPPPYGEGYDLTTTVLAMEGLGHGCQDNGLLFGLNAQLWSVQSPILHFGDAAQKSHYLTKLVSGEFIGAHCVSEPGHGSDMASLRTSAVRDGNSYILNGAKAFITSAPVADVFLVVASTNLAGGTRGLTAFLVDRSTPGLSAARPIEKMGLRTIPMGEVVLRDVRVSVDQRLGQEGAGMSVFNLAMEWERSFLLAPTLGTMRRQIEMCVYLTKVRDHSDELVSGGSIMEMVAEMDVRLEASRLLTYKAAWMKGTRRRLTREPSLVKLFTSEAFVRNSDDALQVHGATGYLDASSLERDLRDARASKLYSGTSEIQKTIIARWLGV